MAPKDLVLFNNIALSDVDTSGQTSLVGQPGVGNNGREIFMTGNWYATRSLDAGNSWQFMSPSTFLPSVDGGFCCDQTTLYDTSRDITIWILQYSLGVNNTNTLRVAVKRGDTLGNNVWHWYDFQASDFGLGPNEELDYNHAALSNDYLYVGTNSFVGETFTTCVIMRLSLDELAAGSVLNYSTLQRQDSFSMRCVQGARDTMYIASHVNNQALRLFAWPEGAGAASVYQIPVTPWNAGVYGKPWLGRCDPRITGAWVANGVIGFMWTVNSRGTRLNPHIRVVRINEETKAVINQPSLWGNDTAFAYPDAAPNDRGEVGVTLFQGNNKPQHVVGIFDGATKSWDLALTSSSTHQPNENVWGDYITCRRHTPDGLTWLATGFTLQGGNTLTDIVPRVVQFGRERDTRAVARWANA